MMEKIAHLSNLEEGMTVVICKAQASYTVHVLDEESGNYLPIVRHYPDFETAISYARAFVSPQDKPLTVRI